MNYCAVMYQKYVYINPRWKIFRINCAIACRLQVHLLPSSRVPDNCLAFALSYQGDTDYVSGCCHDHDITCYRCELLTYIVCKIESALDNVQISSHEKGEMKYVVSPAKKDLKHGKLKELKATMPELRRVHFRQDNAGCYHSAFILLVIEQVAKKSDINITADFSDPQWGKGSCDRKAATIKSHMMRFLNSGHDIETAEQMTSAMESSGGVPGVRVMFCGSQDILKPVAVKREGVSFINNIEYGSNGMRVWRSYTVGPN